MLHPLLHTSSLVQASKSGMNVSERGKNRQRDETRSRHRSPSTPHVVTMSTTSGLPFDALRCCSAAGRLQHQTDNTNKRYGQRCVSRSKTDCKGTCKESVGVTCSRVWVVSYSSLQKTMSYAAMQVRCTYDAQKRSASESQHKASQFSMRSLLHHGTRRYGFI